MTDKQIRLVAELLAGLLVPRSINNGSVLGAAREPFDKLRYEFKLFGWQDADEIEAAMRETIKHRDHLPAFIENIKGG